MANTSHKPTKESRAQVEALCGYGITEDEIATYIGIAPKTLRKHYRMELDTAVIKANALVARSLHKQATEGNVSAAIFWLKVRAGWSEKTVLDLTSSDQSMTPVPAMSRDELCEVVRAVIDKF